MLFDIHHPSTVHSPEMDIVEQKEKLNICNIDHLTVDNVNSEKSKHGSLLPNTVRCIVSGPSNCGKTNVAMNLIIHENGLRFNNVYVYSKSLHQPKYQLLERAIQNVPNVSYFKFNSDDSIMQPHEAKPYSIFIFDDVSCENHNMIMKYFCMGRHNHVDSIYIGQTYSKIPKQLIRDNVNLLILFKQDDTNLKHVYSDHVGTDMSYDRFKEACFKAWKDKYGFLVIDKEQFLDKGRYRIGFDNFIIIN